MVSNTRIFSFGLGDSPSRSLIKGVARSTNGQFSFILPDTNVYPSVCEQLRRALQPCITDTQIIWKFAVDVKSIPRRLPPVYFNDRFIVYGLFDNSTIPFNHDSSAELVRVPNHQTLAVAQINRIPSVSDNGIIARLAAKALILELQHEKNSSEEFNVQSQTENNSILNSTETTTSQEKIMELSLKYSILCPYTAFVGIEKRQNTTNNNITLREVPIQISNSYMRNANNIATNNMMINYAAMSPDYCPSSPAYVSGCPVSLPCYSPAYFPTSPTYSPTPPTYSPTSPCYSPTFAGYSPNSLEHKTSSSSRARSCSTDSAPVRSPKKSVTSSVKDDEITTDDLTVNNTKKRKYDKDDEFPNKLEDIVCDLINKQRFNGCWILDTKYIEHLTCKPLEQFQSKYSQLDSEILVSMIVIATLEKKFKAFELLWYGVVKKSRNYLNELLKHQSKNLHELLADISKEL